MTPQMQEALYQISLCHDPDPSGVFQRIVETVSHHYDNTMAMINLQGDGCMRFRAVVNPHPQMRMLESLALRHTF